ncbi:restriction endonuclease subunit S [Roseivirga sp. BDSF3-8]|uniref:restriction endonuclease subunit S n=1 Tax=Roseivirga sp. BDSF3-8 TaxID=3241598 RepID=UPI00353183C9
MENNTTKKELPEGWEWTTLGRVIELEYGKSLPKRVRNQDGEFSVFGSNGIVGRHDEHLLDGPGVIVGRKGSAGVVHYTDKAYWPIDTTYFVQPKDKYVLKFIYFLLISLRLDNYDRSTAIPGLNRNDAYDIEVGIPHPTVQKQIVEKIEALFSELDHAEAGMERNLRRLQRYRQSLLRQAFSGALTADWRRDNPPAPASQLLQQIAQARKAHHQQAIHDWQQALTQWEEAGKPGRKPTKSKAPKTLPPLTPEERAALPEIPEGWEWVRANELIDDIDNGYTPKANFLSPGDGEIPFLKVYNLKFDGTLNFKKDPYFIPDDIHKEKLKRSITEPGDVLINIVGPPLGKVSIATDQFKEWNINQAIVRYRPNDFVSSKWLSYYMQDLHTITWLENTSKATAGQYNVKVSTCRELPIPLIDIKEQTQIVNELEERLSVVEQLEAATRTALLKSKNLRRSILQRAFEGKLV